MSNTVETIERLSALHEQLRSMLGTETDPKIRKQLANCAELLQESRTQVEQLAGSPSVAESFEASILASRAASIQGRDRALHRAEQLRTMSSPAQEGFAKGRAIAAAAKARIATAPAPPPIAPDFIPPLRTSLLQYFGYLTEKPPAPAGAGPDIADWAIRSATIVEGTDSRMRRVPLENSIRSVADSLDERRAVWWASLVILDIAAKTGRSAEQLEEQVVNACQWAMNPQDGRFAVIEPAGGTAETASPALLLSLAIHYAGTPEPRFAEFVAGPRRCQRAAALAVIRTLQTLEPATDVDPLYRLCIEFGNDIARGLRLWPPTAPAEAENAKESRKSSFDSWLNSSLGSRQE